MRLVLFSVIATSLFPLSNVFAAEEPPGAVDSLHH